MVQCLTQQDGSLHGGASFRGLDTAAIAAAVPELGGPLLALDSDDDRPLAGESPTSCPCNLIAPCIVVPWRSSDLTCVTP